MMDTINVGGFTFEIQGEGFIARHAEDDFRRGVEAARKALTALDGPVLKALVAEMMAWEGDECEGDQPEALADIEAQASLAATSGWHKPEAAYVYISLP